MKKNYLKTVLFAGLMAVGLMAPQASFAHVTGPPRGDALLNILVAAAAVPPVAIGATLGMLFNAFKDQPEFTPSIAAFSALCLASGYVIKKMDKKEATIAVALIGAGFAGATAFCALR